LQQFSVDSVRNKLEQYKQNWLNHISRMEDQTLDTLNNSLAIDIVGEDLDNH